MKNIALSIPMLFLLAFPLTAGAMTQGDGACSMPTNLAFGSRGDDVVCLQKELMQEGLLGIDAATGYFGDLTKSAVQKWQSAHGVYSSGFFGPLSRSAWQPATPTMQMAAKPPHTVPAGMPAPTVALTVLNDSESGYNVHAITANFTFTPEHVGGTDVEDEGHAHLLVDGTMINRMYSNWYHLNPLPAGTHTITVELETNSHEDYYANGVQVATSTTISIQLPATSSGMTGSMTGGM